MVEKPRKLISVSPTEEYLIALLRACLNGTTAPEKPEAVSWKALFYTAKQQSVAAIAYTAVKKLKVQPQGESLTLWSEWYDKLIAKSVNQFVEAQKLLEDFNRAKIRIMPLKGYFLSRIYPSPELREMSDIDLLVDEECFEIAEEIMKRNGFRWVSKNKDHVEYKKLPYVLVEIHNNLMNECYELKAFYEKPWKHLTTDPVLPYVCYMEISDMYVYFVAHYYKHYYSYGCGIRTLVDFWLFTDYFRQQMDWNYIEEKLKKQGLFYLSDTALSLANTWFGNGTYDDAQRKMELRLFRSGTYGKRSLYDSNRISRLSEKNGSTKVGRWRYFMRIAFPKKEDMETRYPVLRKVGILLPLFWLVRGVDTVIRNPKRIKQYYDRIMKADV